MSRNKPKRFGKEERELMEKNLELTKKFLLEVIKNPKKLENIPSGATIILSPVKV